MPGGSQVRAYTGSQDAFNIGLEKFLEEARHLAQFGDHPGIIRVLDFFEENGTGYMVMEYLDGSTLDQYVTATGPLNIPVILELLIPVADALRACHAAGLIHRDISPDNIFLTSDGRVKLLDFGAARAAIGSQSTNLSVILKEGYAPFEQYQRNGRQGPWTDIYALTATLYRLLTGDLPVTAPDRVAGMPLPSPSEKGVQLPQGLQALLDKGLAIRSEQRYQTIDDFLSDLKAVRRTPSPDNRKRRLVIAFASAIASIGAVAVPLFFWMYPAPPWVQQTELTREPGALPKDNSAPAEKVVTRAPPPQDSGPPPEKVVTRVPPPQDTGPPPEKVVSRAPPPQDSGPPPEKVVTRAPPPQDSSPPPEKVISRAPPPQDSSPPPEKVVTRAPPPQESRPPPEKVVTPAPPPRAPPITSTESARVHVKRAAQDEIDLAHAGERARGASNSLDKLRAITVKPEPIQNAIQKEENVFNSAIHDREALLDDYMAEVEWLGEHDAAAVDAALQLESESVATPSLDPGKAAAKAEMERAIKLLASHVRAQRQNQLKREKVIADAS
jgi:serine/threonine protein kinase